MSRKITNIDAGDLVQRYTDGISVKELAEHFSVCRQVISRILLESGQHLRNRSLAMYARMSRTPKQERNRLTEAAHDAVRGRKIDVRSLIKSARTKQNTLSKVGYGEFILRDWIRERSGVNMIPQYAIERYNIDLAAPPRRRGIADPGQESGPSISR